jgi:ribose-phosphate pyrophosphokinase
MFFLMVKYRGDIALIACQSGFPLAQRIHAALTEILAEEGFQGDVLAVETIETHFASSEVKTQIKQSIRGNDVYVIQDCENSTGGHSVDTNFQAAKTALDAAWAADAHYTTLVVPSLPYARQDKKKGREGITVARTLREIELCNADRVITLDVHNSAVFGALRRTKFENLHAKRVLVGHVRGNFDLRNLAIVAPDTSALGECASYASHLGLSDSDVAVIWKKRDYSVPNSIDKMVLIGDVEGKDILLIDDMIDTAGTLVKACEVAKGHGARSIHAIASLPLLNGPALERLSSAFESNVISSIIGTDAVYHGGEEFFAANPWYREVSIAPCIARAIAEINNYGSVSRNFLAD